MSNDIDLDELREKVEAAIQADTGDEAGQWEHAPDTRTPILRGDLTTIGHDEHWEFIAASDPDTVLGLIERIKELEDEHE